MQTYESSKLAEEIDTGWMARSTRARPAQLEAFTLGQNLEQGNMLLFPKLCACFTWSKITTGVQHAECPDDDGRVP